MILGFKQKFSDGTPTHFKEKILNGSKIHSIRKGMRWRTDMFIQMAYGVRTPHYHCFKDGVCLRWQAISMTYGLGELQIKVRDRYLSHEEIQILIANDGLSREQFISWFFPKGTNEFSGQIIHWTWFKY